MPLCGDASVTPASTKTPANRESQKATWAQPLKSAQSHTLSAAAKLESASIAAQARRQRIQREDVAPGLAPAHDFGSGGPEQHRRRPRLDKLHRLRVAIRADIRNTDDVADLERRQHCIVTQAIRLHAKRTEHVDGSIPEVRGAVQAGRATDRMVVIARRRNQVDPGVDDDRVLAFVDRFFGDDRAQELRASVNDGATGLEHQCRPAAEGFSGLDET